MAPNSNDFETRLAARILFGGETDLNDEFWQNLDPSVLKSAFRKKALETHPDRALALGKGEMLLRLQFQRLSDAYEKLSLAIQNDPSSVQMIIESPEIAQEIETEVATEATVDVALDVAPAVEGAKATFAFPWLPVIAATFLTLGTSTQISMQSRTVAPAALPEPVVLKVEARTVELADNLYGPGKYAANEAVQVALQSALGTVGTAGNMDTVRITVIGHADSVPVRHFKHELNNNGDLSLMRARSAVQMIEAMNLRTGSVLAIRAEGAGSTLRNTRSLTVRVETIRAAGSRTISMARLATNIAGMVPHVNVSATRTGGLEVQFQDNLFASGQFEATEEIANAIRALADQILISGRSVSVTVIGYADHVPFAGNSRLATQRSLAAVSILRDSGFSADVLQYVNGADRDTRSIGVRVEVI